MKPRAILALTLTFGPLAAGLGPVAIAEAPAATPPQAKPAVLKPGDNLVADGIPEIPAALAETVGRYTEFRSAALAGWHPTRREMLIGTRFADTAAGPPVKLPGGARTPAHVLPRPRAAAPASAATRGDYFVFSKDTGGDEFCQIYRYDLATGAVTLLTDGNSQNSRGVWSHARATASPTPRRAATARDSDLYVIDPGRPEAPTRLAPRGARAAAGRPLDWSPDDSEAAGRRIRLGQRELPLAARRGQRREDAAHARRAAREGRLRRRASSPRTARGSTSTTDKDSEFQRLAHLDLATGKHTVLTAHIPWDVDDFELSPDGKRIAFVDQRGRRRRAAPARHRDAARRRPRPEAAGRASSAACEWHNERPRPRLHARLGARRPPTSTRSTSTDAARSSAGRESETGGLEPGEPSPSRSWCAGRASTAGRSPASSTSRPRSFTGQRPVIVNIHGGPEGQSRPGFLGRNNYFLNELGVAMLFPNVRGSTGYGKTLPEARQRLAARGLGTRTSARCSTGSPTRPDLDADARHGHRRQLRRLHDAGRGHALHATASAARVDVVGISNFVTFLENTEAYRRDLRRVEYGDERDPKMREFLRTIAPLEQRRARSRSRCSSCRAKNDPRVPLDRGRADGRPRCKKNGGPVWYLMAKDEGHGFAKKKNADFQFYATLALFREHLLE